MRWNQPPEKTVKAECTNNMNFVKPTHGDDAEVPLSKQIKQSTFDPGQSEHRLLLWIIYCVMFWNLSQTLVYKSFGSQTLLLIAQLTVRRYGVLLFFSCPCLDNFSRLIL